MDQPPVTKDRQNVLRGDVLFACSMVVVYCGFITALIALPFWDSKQTQQIISAESTSTAMAVSTQQVQTTATVLAHTTEQAQYKFMDTFDEKTIYWDTESINDEYMRGSVSINTGLYVWNAYDVKQTFVHWESFHGGYSFDDFDVYIDTKIFNEVPGGACSGFVFRTASVDWEEGAYTFSVCSDSYFDIDYYEQGTWETILDQVSSSAAKSNDWNRLEIRARGNHFAFFINNEEVYEMTDERQPTGGLALFVDFQEEKPATIWFDNFGLQPR